MLLKLITFFFFNDTATTEIYTLSLHDALPILPVDVDGYEIRTRNRKGGGIRRAGKSSGGERTSYGRQAPLYRTDRRPDRKSTRLNSSHANISYAVFCLKKKKKKYSNTIYQIYK